MSKGQYHQLFKRAGTDGFTVEYWDGEERDYGTSSPGFRPGFRLVFHEEVPFTQLLANPIVAAGEAYMDGQFDIEGDPREAMRMALSLESSVKESWLARTAGVFWKRQQSASRREQEKGVRDHYDLGNDFFSLWLDETMTYSSAYFETPGDSLEQAQRQKNVHILKKVELKPGETLLDIGSGWGQLVIQAARDYDVRATGITLSTEQVAKSQEVVRDLGLEDRVRIGQLDYRDLARSGRTFDKVVSVGMFEHVGKAHHDEFIDAVDRLLKPGGLLLLHTITHPKEGPVNPWLEKYIFPWGYIPSLRETIWALGERDFRILDVESLRRHYGMTTDRWARNFEKVRDQVAEMYDERFARMWYLWLIGCTTSFNYGDLDIHQILCSKGLNNDLPLTRRHLYEE